LPQRGPSSPVFSLDVGIRARIEDQGKSLVSRTSHCSTSTSHVHWLSQPAGALLRSCRREFSAQTGQGALDSHTGRVLRNPLHGADFCQAESLNEPKHERFSLGPRSCSNASNNAASGANSRPAMSWSGGSSSCGILRSARDEARHTSLAVPRHQRTRLVRTRMRSNCRARIRNTAYAASSARSGLPRDRRQVS